MSNLKSHPTRSLARVELRMVETLVRAVVRTKQTGSIDREEKINSSSVGILSTILEFNRILSVAETSTCTVLTGALWLQKDYITLPVSRITAAVFWLSTAPISKAGLGCLSLIDPNDCEIGFRLKNP